MPLRRLLRRSAAVSGGLRRSLATAASHPPWAALCHSAWTVGAPGAQVRLAEPPRSSEVYVPEQLLKTGPLPDPDGDGEGGGGEVVDVRRLDVSDRHEFIERVFRVADEDNQRFLQKLRDRIDR